MIKWGVIGTGHMANIFAESIQETDNAKLVAVSSRTKKSLEIFGDKFESICHLYILFIFNITNHQL